MRSPSYKEGPGGGRGGHMLEEVGAGTSLRPNSKGMGLGLYAGSAPRPQAVLSDAGPFPMTMGCCLPSCLSPPESFP